MINLEREEGGRFNGKQTQTWPPRATGAPDWLTVRKSWPRRGANTKTDVYSEVWRSTFTASFQRSSPAFLMGLWC